MPKTRQPAPLPPPTQVAGAIIHELERCRASGNRPAVIFEDWLALVEATLCQLPAHYAAARATGRPAADPADVQALWARIRPRYPQAIYWDHFSRARAILLNGADTYQDYVIDSTAEKPGAYQSPDL